MIPYGRKKTVLVLAVFVLVLSPAAAKSTFGTGNGEPLPNVTNVTVHDVTGLSTSEKETGGTLEDHGLNTTLTVNQLDTTREYRFSFRVRNDGDTDWSLESADQLFHDGLNSSWTVNKIWYNISQDYDSGTFSGGQVEWNTSQGGTLASGGVMYAKYLVEPSLDSSQLFSQRFLVNDTSSNAGSQDYHELDINKLGYLSLALEDPPNDTVLTQNKTFTINSTVTCRDGECGSVDLSARYNQSSSADTLIPESSGEPFYTLNSNSRECSLDLKKDESCYIEWDVNTTGDLESYHLLDANASSSYTEISNNDTEDHLVQINMAILINVTWDKTDFGVLDPGQDNQSAQNNSDLLYNVTVPQQSNTVDDLWVKATDMESINTDYTIGAGNLSYGLQNSISEERSLSNSYSHVISDLSPGSILNTFYWIDVPTGIYKGGYTGEIFFKGNSTR